MMQLLVFLAFVLALIALERARSADRRLVEVMERLRQLEARLAGQTGLPADVPAQVTAEVPIARPPAAPGGPARPPLWPEDAHTAPLDLKPAEPAPPPSRPRGPSIWGPEFSRARISVIGGALVLLGLAFTLRALGLPDWTLLLAVFAFGGLLYGVARHTPQPVSGALRGLGYGVTALGVGSLAQLLPETWGPGAVMLGLLGLGAALAWDGQRRREPLLGALAVGGSALSVWLLADDLGRVSILAAGAVMLLSGVAVAGARVGLAGAPELAEPGPGGLAEQPAVQPMSADDWRAALALTLGVAGVVPLGWLVASINHQTGLWDVASGQIRAGETRDGLERVLLLGGDGPLGLLTWAAFAVLALAPVLALLRGPALPAPSRSDARLRLAGVWAGLAPFLPVILAVGVGLDAQGRTVPQLLAVLALLAALLGAATWAWRLARVPEEASAAAFPEAGLPGALAGALTAATTGVLGAALVAVLGLRSQPSALAGVALALLLLGLHGRSRVWLRLGALGLGLVAVWSVLVGVGENDAGWLLDALPALIGLAGALRLATDRWAMMPGRGTPQFLRPLALDDALPQPPVPSRSAPRRTASWLAAASSLVLILSLGSDLWLQLIVTLALAAALWLGRSPVLSRRWPGTEHVADTLRAATMPGLGLGGLWLLSALGGPLLLGSVVAGLSLLWHARHRFTEGLALTLLFAALVLELRDLWPGDLWLSDFPLTDGVPAAAAAVALIAALIPRALSALRVDLLLGLGLLGGWTGTLAGEPTGIGPTLMLVAGTLLTLAVWFLTRAPAGQAWLRAALPRLSAGIGALPPLAPAARPLWLAALVAPPILGLGLLIQAPNGIWYSLASVAMLLVGLRTCVHAFREAASPDARARWTAGVVVMIAAGLKGATLDAMVYPAPAVAAGLAVLVSGLSLLLLAIQAPRPPAVPSALAEASGPAEPASLG